MKLICFHFLCLLLFLAWKESAVAATPHQSCQISDQLEEECSVYAFQVTKPMLRYFEQVTQKIDKHSAEIEEMHTKHQRELQTKNDRIHHLEETEIELQRQIKKLEIENAICKTKENSMGTVREELRKQIEQLSNNLLNNLNNNNDITSQKTIIATKEQRVKKNKARSCFDIDSSGVQRLTLSDGYNLNVLCDSDIVGHGWTVIQQRVKGGVDFYRDWDTYRVDFGDFWSGDFFLGLDKIHRLTADQPQELYIHMMRFDGTTFFARYDEFAISGEEDDYRLSKLGTFYGTTIDYLTSHKNMKFSTHDRDNDNSVENCAVSNHGGWWYDNCAASNLNGIYFQTTTSNIQSNYWEDYAALKQVKMMIRPKVV